MTSILVPLLILGAMAVVGAIVALIVLRGKGLSRAQLVWILVLLAALTASFVLTLFLSVFGL